MNDKQRNAVLEYLEDCASENIKDTVFTVQCHVGGLEDLEWFYMEEFDMFMDGKLPLQIAIEVCNAGDDFNPYDRYFHWDSMGNLVSSDTIEYDKYDLDDIIDGLESMNYRDLPRGIQEILDENADDEEDEDYEEDEEDDEEE